MPASVWWLHVVLWVMSDPIGGKPAQANLQEGRLDMGRTVFHGRKGELTRAYLDGMENQGYPARDEDAARLSPFTRRHIRLDGHYSFHLPDLGRSHRPLRDPDAPDEDDRIG